MLEENIHYFAYGSNMSTRYLENIRSVKPQKSQAAYLKNHRLTFTIHGIAILEPAFANIQQAQGASVHGVLHTISRSESERILQSESIHYQLKNLDVIADCGNAFTAKILISHSAHQNIEKPASKRYMTILINGATEHKLPQSYIDFLREKPTSYIPILSEIAGWAIMAWVRVKS